MVSDLANISDVKVEESKLLSIRREKADLEPEDSAILTNTTGLALSGGGVRSASFNLGILQAFHKFGVLRYVDYLSTVSGGSYIGAAITSEGQSLAKKKKTIFDNDSFSLRQESDGRSTLRVRELLRKGSYLDWMLHALNSYLFGLLLINLLIGSVILLIGVILAIFWRLLDTPPICELILSATGGMLVESIRPFLPSFVCILAWIISRFIAPWRCQSRSRWIDGCTFFALLGLLSSSTILLGITYYAFSEDFTWFQSRPAIRVLLPLPLIMMTAWPIAWMISSSRSDLMRVLLLRILPVAGLVGFAIYLTVIAVPLAMSIYVILGILVVGFILCVYFWNCTYNLVKCSPGPCATSDEAIMRVRWLLVLAGIFGLIGSVVWLATPEPNISPIGAMEPNVSRISEWVLVPLGGVLLTSLLPLLSPRRLLESGIRPKRFWEPIVFRATTAAALLGVPLLGVWYFAHHNYSEIVPKKPSSSASRVSDADIRYELLLDRINKEGTDRARPNKLLARELGARDVKVPAAPIFEADRIAHRNAAAHLDALVEQGAFVSFYLNNIKLNNADRDAIKSDALTSHPNGKSIVEKLDRLERGVDGVKDRELNRLLLEVYYPDGIKRMTEVRRTNVIMADQRVRLIPLCGFAILAFVAAWLIDLNKASMHSFYKKRLAQVYISPNLLDTNAKAESDFATESLHNFQQCVASGAPIHLIATTRNTWEFRGKSPTIGEAELDTNNVGAPQLLPNQISTFVLSALFCGPAADGRYERTESYIRRCSNGLTLGDATAMSGAAVSPTQMDTAVHLFLMMILNMRLGQWLPSIGSEIAKDSAPTSVVKIIRGVFGHPAQKSYHFLSDGGHHENLGIDPLLDRRCRVIIVSDASRDPSFAFRDFIRLYRRARLEKGIIFCDPRDARKDLSSKELETLRPSNVINPPAGGQVYSESPNHHGQSTSTQPNSSKHFFIAGIRYPEDSFPNDLECQVPPLNFLIYLKSTLTGDEPIDLKAHRDYHSEFPHDTTANQFFTSDQVESYRALGFHIGKEIFQVLRFCDPEGTGENRKRSPSDVFKSIESFLDRETGNEVSEEAPYSFTGEEYPLSKKG